MSKSRLTALAAVLAALAAGGCTGGNDASTSSGETSSSVAAQAFDADRPAPAEPVEGAVSGGTVTMLTSFGFEHGYGRPDPSASYTWASFMSAYVTRSLTQYVYDPAQDAMVVVPDIATDIGRPNADFTEWTYTIRDGVRFEDGTEITAEDVAYGIKRSFDRTAFPSGPPYSNEFFLHGDTYRGPWRPGANDDGIVVDGDTLTLKMEHPFPDMPYWGTFPAMGPVPAEGSNPVSYWEHPLATGPYMFGAYKPGASLTLVRNPEWDPETDPGRNAYPDRVIARFGVAAGQIARTILGDSAAGRATFTRDTLFLEEPAYERAQTLGRVTTGTAPCTYMWSPDYRKITDVRLRRAIGYAYPYRAAAEAIGQPRTLVPSQTLLPLGFPGRRDFRTLETEPGVTDPAKAKALVREARADGVPAAQFVLSWPFVKEFPWEVARARVVSAALEAVGFTAKPLPLSEKAWGAYNYSAKSPVNIRWGSWCPDWMSGSNWLPPVLGSKGSGTTPTSPNRPSTTPSTPSASCRSASSRRHGARSTRTS
jgi:peptide/nickel transport system substrate-binding protein